MSEDDTGNTTEWACSEGCTMYFGAPIKIFGADHRSQQADTDLFEIYLW